MIDDMAEAIAAWLADDPCNSVLFSKTGSGNHIVTFQDGDGRRYCEVAKTVWMAFCGAIDAAKRMRAWPEGEK